MFTSTDRQETLHVLFIGNSQVNYIHDIPEMLERIARSTNNRQLPLIVCDKVVIGGIGLEGYWKDGRACERIAAGYWDYVVINDIIYSYDITDSTKFSEYAAKFNGEITKAGASPVIFVTADVENQREQHVNMYQDALAFARLYHCRVAGAGMAWLKVWEKEPTLDLYHTDRAHPNAAGFYLNACVLYATLTGSNPAEQDITTCDAAEKNQAKLLQEIAWAQFQDDRENEKSVR